MKLPKLAAVVLMLLLSTTCCLLGQERKIKAGDAIEIVVYGHQELSRVVMVSPQGTIDFPFMQNVPVDGQSLDRVRELVVAQMARYLNSYPIVTIAFAKSNTIIVSVLGMVIKPGVVQIPLYSTLQAAIGAAGGFAPGARVAEVTLVRTENGISTSSSYDMEKFLLEGDLKLNPMLNEGNVIMVTGNPILSSVKVIGEVRTPGAFSTYTGATVFDMLLMAGGPTENADLTRIRYVTPSRKRTFEYKINLNKSLTADDYFKLPMVKPGDIIYVPKKKSYLKYALNALNSTVSVIAMVSYVIYYQSH